MKAEELDILYRKYAHALFLYALSLTRCKEDAEDLVADTFIKAYLSYREGSIKSWLFTVLKHNYIDMYRKKKKLINGYEMNLVEDIQDIMKQYITEERKCWLYTKIYSFEKREQEILLLSIVWNMKDIEIANALHIRVENVRTIRHRCRKKLISLAKKEGYL